MRDLVNGCFERLVPCIERHAGAVTRFIGDEIMAVFRELNQQGTTILQVTHSDRNAAYGNRIVHLHDGLISNQPMEQ